MQYPGEHQTQHMELFIVLENHKVAVYMSNFFIFLQRANLRVARKVRTRQKLPTDASRQSMKRARRIWSSTQKYAIVSFQLCSWRGGSVHLSRTAGLTGNRFQAEGCLSSSAAETHVDQEHCDEPREQTHHFPWTVAPQNVYRE